VADGRNLLVLVLDDGAEERLRDAIESREDPPERVQVIAPALVKPLDWLATDESRAQRQAEARALGVEWVLADHAQVGGEAGDVDPAQALEDALRSFDADEILVAGRTDPELDARLARLGIPVRWLDPAEVGTSRTRAFHTLVAGRNEALPFVLFAGVNLALVLFAVLLSLFVLLVLWLAGSL
jgi:hypothetical protein